MQIGAYCRGRTEHRTNGKQFKTHNVSNAFQRKKFEMNRKTCSGGSARERLRRSVGGRRKEGGRSDPWQVAKQEKHRSRMRRLQSEAFACPPSKKYCQNLVWFTAIAETSQKLCRSRSSSPSRRVSRCIAPCEVALRSIFNAGLQSASVNELEKREKALAAASASGQ